MYNETKILLTVYTEGGTLRRSSEPIIKEFVLKKKDIAPNQKFKNGDGNKIVKKGKYKVYPFDQPNSTLQTKLCKEAYEYMTSSQCPEWFRDIKSWRRMKAKDRLEIHLARTCQHFGGKYFTYSIIDD